MTVTVEVLERNARIVPEAFQQPAPTRSAAVTPANSPQIATPRPPATSSALGFPRPAADLSAIRNTVTSNRYHSAAYRAGQIARGGVELGKGIGKGVVISQIEQVAQGAMDAAFDDWVGRDRRDARFGKPAWDINARTDSRIYNEAYAAQERAIQNRNEVREKIDQQTEELSREASKAWENARERATSLLDGLTEAARDFKEQLERELEERKPKEEEKEPGQREDDFGIQIEDSLPLPPSEEQAREENPIRESPIPDETLSDNTKPNPPDVPTEFPELPEDWEDWGLAEPEPLDPLAEPPDPPEGEDLEEDELICGGGWVLTRYRVRHGTSDVGWFSVWLLNPRRRFKILRGPIGPSFYYDPYGSVYVYHYQIGTTLLIRADGWSFRARGGRIADPEQDNSNPSIRGGFYRGSKYYYLWGGTLYNETKVFERTPGGYSLIGGYGGGTHWITVSNLKFECDHGQFSREKRERGREMRNCCSCDSIRGMLKSLRQTLSIPIVSCELNAETNVWEPKIEQKTIEIFTLDAATAAGTGEIYRQQAEIAIAQCEAKNGAAADINAALGFPVTVPKYLNAIEGESEGEDEDENTEEITNLVELYKNWIQIFDGLMGEFPVKLEITTDENQEHPLELPTVADALGDLFSLAVPIFYDADNSFSLATKMAGEQIKFNNTVWQTYYLLYSISEQLGFDLKKKPTKLSYPIDPRFPDDWAQFNKEWVPEENNVEKFENDDKQTLKGILLELAQAIGPMKAALIENVKPDDLFDRVKKLNEIIQIGRSLGLGENLSQIRDSDWEAILQQLSRPGSATSPEIKVEDKPT